MLQAVILKLNSHFNTFLMGFIFFFHFFSANLFKYSYLIFIFFIESLLEYKGFNPIKILLNKSSINLDLTNGLLLIHPFLLYFACCYIISFFFRNSLFIKNNLSYLFLNKSNTLDIVILLLIIMMSIALGSLWAEQELNWGGWWSWDVIELVSLHYLFLFLFFSHLPKKYIKYNYIYANIFSNFIIFTIIIKFNFLNSIHNFLLIDSSFQNFYEIFIYYLLFIIVINNFKVFTKKTFFNLNQVNILFFFFFFINLLSYTYIFSEFFFIFSKKSNLFNLFLKNTILIKMLFSLFILFIINHHPLNFIYASYLDNFYVLLLFKSKSILAGFVHFIFIALMLCLGYVYLYLHAFLYTKNILLTESFSISDHSSNYKNKFFVNIKIKEKHLFRGRNIFLKDIFCTGPCFWENPNNTKTFFLNLNLNSIFKIFYIYIFFNFIFFKILHYLFF